MNEQNFNNDIGQVAGGDVVHNNNGPTQSNVITINGAAPPEKPPTITSLQRRAIFTKAKPIAMAGGVKVLDIYGMIFTQFGIERIVELPRAEFLDAMAFLSDLEKGDSDSDTAADEESGAVAQSPAPAIHVHSVPCHGCVGLSDHLKTSTRQTVVARRWSVAMAFSAAVVTVGVGAGLATGRLEAKGITDSVIRCEFEGQSYSPGSLITIPSSVVRECLPDVQGHGAHWANVASASKRR
ncbi:hypothetical protein [Pandoraea fibrosis]|uniref:Uncharacterized protein n=1 Tax=Pandoraea fibrosis TaxID=1891094 RepID=A0A5E4SSW9_9BURK|nr:hypothetical protein [Pandoraea fibrosis]VVD78181.1 hypothetical protein PFI31113_00968 [Pandoraea fibrosis]